MSTLLSEGATGLPEFSSALRTFERALFDYRARKPRTNVLKGTWVLVHQTSPQYATALADERGAAVDGFVLVRVARRSGWAKQLPKESIACLIAIGESQKAFPVSVDSAVRLDGLVALDLLQALFEGAPSSKTPALLRAPA